MTKAATGAVAAETESMNSLRPRLVGTLALALGMSVPLVVVFGQQEEVAPPQPTFRTGVNLVRVDVTVNGRGDEPVADLQASDFEIKEDDVIQKVEAFQFVQLDGQKMPGDDMSLDIRSRQHGAAEAARDDVRVFALFLDDYHVSEDLATTQRIRKVLEDWIEEAIKPTDIVVLMDPLLPISGLEYSRSKFDLIEKVKKFKGREGVYVPVRSALEEGQLQTRNPRRIRAEVTLSALNAIVTHLGSLRERRTSVIFVSQGPPLRFGDGELESYMRDVLEAANKFNVTINVLDPAGLTFSSARDSLWRLAGETGGRAIVNTNGMLGGLLDVARDASAYYLVGYSPSRGESDGKFHKIDVKVNRRGVDVRSRRGYWAPSAKEMTAAVGPVVPAPVRQALAVFSQLAVGRRASTWIGFEPAAGGNTTVRMSWQPSRVTGGDADLTETLVLSAKRDTLEVVGETRVPLSSEQAPPSGRAGYTTFVVAPGELKLNVLAESKSGEIVDRWAETLVVPHFSSSVPVLVTPWLLLARSVPEYRALTAAGGNGVPSPAREFRRTDRVLVRTVAYAAPGPVAVVASLLTKAGAQLIKLAAAARADGVVQVELPLANLAAGEYVLSLSVADLEERANQYVAFRLIP